MLGHVDFVNEIIRQKPELAGKLRRNFGRYINNHFNAVIWILKELCVCVCERRSFYVVVGYWAMICNIVT